MHFAKKSNKGKEACYLIHNITPRLSMQIHLRLQAYDIHDPQEEGKTANTVALILLQARFMRKITQAIWNIQSYDLSQSACSEE